MASPSVEETSRCSTSPSRPPGQDETVQPSAEAADGGDTAAAAAAPDLAPTQESASSSPPPPPFEPLFTLLTNASTNTTVHPRVHYVFSDDDDTAILSAEQQQRQQQQQSRGGEEEPARRAIVVDLAPNADNDAWTVSCASSLNPAFAVTSTDLAKQQSGGGTSVEGDGGNGALMLRVEGVSREPVEIRPDASLPSSGSGSGAVGTEDVESLADEFRRRMGILKKVVGESEKRTGLIQQKQKELDEEARGAYERTDDDRAASDNDSPGGSRAQEAAAAADEP